MPLPLGRGTIRPSETASTHQHYDRSSLTVGCPLVKIEAVMILRILVVGPLSENTYIVGSEESKECIIIDPGAQGDLVLQNIQEQGLTVKYIIITHGHSDHTAAIATIKETTNAPYGIHENDVPLLNNGGSMIPDFREPPNPDFHLKEEDTLEIGELKFQVIETPGHTPGSVCLYGHGLLFTGDTLFQGTIGRYDFPGSDGQLLVKNIKTKLLVLPDDTQVLPGHGPHSTIGDEKRWNPFLSDRGIPRL